MKTIIIDSATNILYTAFLEDEQVVFESYIPGKNDHASAIVVEIEKALKKAGTELSKMDRVVVGVGPGSYTGVRMAVTVGKMIATLEASIKLYTISTLVLMASGKHGKVLATIDARRGNCFGCIYDMEKMSYIENEAFQEVSILESKEYDVRVCENDYLVDPILVCKLATPVLEPRLLTPHYLRDTEAERNLYAKKI
ncbi:MAG: tRNA (adenosine(37)-N6)-threonylcarbamoyltransferase complex dimerization subunit type 1 TsaB [Anaeroplasmataceae bacterium]|nr:tRNA (adenosine(37)-N6)-threonylcarbamoyltransferase complex dimerization subunit type 1 TsaB [Anaeroplasmataceae bacterium]